MPKAQSRAFQNVRERIIALDDRDRARLARLFEAMQERQPKLGPAVRNAVRAIAKLDDDDLERLVCWFASYVNRWGRMPKAAGLT
jgi:hypothetical protein